MAEKIIELVNITRKYEKFTAVDNLNLSISKGEIFGLLGPNGAGKSTTILMIMGLTEPTTGEVTVCGINSTTNPIEVKKIVGYLPEDVGFYDDMTGLENIKYTAMLNSLCEKDAILKAKQMLHKVGLDDAADKKTGKYSRGMRQRLGLADVLIKNPEIIILDEPTLGIDPKGVHEFLDLIVSLSREERITVLLSSHDLHYMQQVCDRVGLFVGGKLLAEGDIPTLSDKLFNGTPLVIEVGISHDQKSEIEPYTIEWLSRTLESIKEVKSIKTDNSHFFIECSEDVTSDVAKSIVNSGACLQYLNKKEYGLDDIYCRYFEGGE